MISDEQIKALALARGFKLTNETGDDLKPYVYEFSRDLIALAQEVKPLEFFYDRKAFCFAYADTPFGKYEIDDFDSDFMVSFEQVCLMQSLETCQEAVAAAQSDFAARTLANLKYGGKDD